ncbi:hypothetical protein [Mesorhizobium sp.]|uniref:hypothetical protein n=1 Tax=Mesorhizobium sp. TaxID=1871066 RepID=UPI000FE7BC85|nr:hypothetical protein [Mesorhizobium sp.]RWO08258.1 MAG: hypothetical protein EOS15_30055 [Mesorhizobium sp.]
MATKGEDGLYDYQRATVDGIDFYFKQDVIINTLAEALEDSVRLMEAMGQSVHRPTLNKARAALALARGEK